MEEIYEKLGLFYLGRDIDTQTDTVTDNLTLLKNKNFTTHTAIIGMTGSGKTGLGISLIEEAALDNIPSIVIDPKGDMGNLCLSDPTFSAQNFQPWVADEAQGKGVDPFEYAQEVATRWKEGLQNDFQTPQRVQRFHDVQKTIYTPGSSAGVGINILDSLEAPSQEILEESDTFNSYLKSTVSGLLALVSLESDALDTPEYILLAQIITTQWLQNRSLSIQELISSIITPPFETIGVLPLDTFFPQNKRFSLATKFNALLANPSFASWMQGETLDIQNLLYDENGKAKIAIFSIAHLNDQERMFFVTLLLNKYIAWMRRQSGTSRLKTILYMDEIYGFFPPSKNPPSKEPMLLLLKQARAFGVGVVLSTQNPVDLDYKGLSNIGTWCIGRLQTAQDIERVIDGLSGQNGSAFNKSQIKNILANLKKRRFILKSAHLDDIKLFTTRWVLSYLKGPLKKQEISALMQGQKEQKTASAPQQTKQKPLHTPSQMIQPIDRSIPQYFEPDPSQQNSFYPTLCAQVRIHFYNQRKGIDTHKDRILQVEITQESTIPQWEDAFELDAPCTNYPKKAPDGAQCQPISTTLAKDKGLKKSIKELKEYLYHEEKITLYRVKKLKLESMLDESKRDFIVRVEDYVGELKEEAIEKLKERYSKKEKTLQTRLERAHQRLEKESAQRTSSFFDAGISILGALFSGSKSTTKISRAVRHGSKVFKEQGDISRVSSQIASIEDDMEALAYELEDKIEQLAQKYDLQNYPIEEFAIKPRRSDIDVEHCALVWRVY